MFYKNIILVYWKPQLLNLSWMWFWKKVGMNVSYSTALRGKNQVATVVRGSLEESYKMLPFYLYMLEKLKQKQV